MTSPSGYPIRVISDADISQADALRSAAGWNQTPEDWLRLIRYEPDGCFGALSGERIVGTVTTTRYGNELAWIGMMLVDPDFRGRGIARGLMQSAIEYLKSRTVRCIMLDATPAGEPVYRKLGFVPEWQYSRWQTRFTDNPVVSASANQELPEADTPLVSLESVLPDDCLRLDRQAFGADRSDWLQRLRRSSVMALRTDANSACGFGMLRRGTNAAYLGPVTASSGAVAAAILRQLVSGAVQKCADQSSATVIFWDVPEPCSDAVRFAELMGFQRLRPLTRMRYAEPCIRPRLPLQFAIADPAAG